MAGRRKDRVQMMAGMLLGVTALCSLTLLFAAGTSAVQTFAGEQAAVQTTGLPGRLKGLTIAVDAGHGGYDGGAVGRVSGVPEKGLNLDVAQRLEKLLRVQGADVVMTRTGDYALCDEDPPIRKKLQDMQRRAEIIQLNDADMVLSIHMNEYAGRSESGPQVFYREGCPAGRLLAGAVQEAMIAGLNPGTKRSALGGDYYILTLGVPSVLVECGFLSNREEEQRLLDEGYRQQVAEAVAQGVLDWQALTIEKPQPLEAVDRSDEERGD
ncbi:MAG: N-acetylmuramoyl-L-alanine amidase [Clostridia bacterium]|nr:N-acetylmuramoyl-L-alanine amidase [Clostridia bacterium]